MLGRRAAGAPAAPESVESRQQPGQSRAEQALGAQQALRLGVVLHHAAVAVEHHHAVVHVLDHQLVDARLRGERAAALRASASFAATRCASQLVTPAVAKQPMASSAGCRKLAVGASSDSTQ